MEKLQLIRKRIHATFSSLVEKISKFNDRTNIKSLISRQEALESLWSDHCINLQSIESCSALIELDDTQFREFTEDNVAMHENYLNAQALLHQLIPADKQEEVNNLHANLTAYRNRRLTEIGPENENGLNFEHGENAQNSFNNNVAETHTSSPLRLNQNAQTIIPFKLQPIKIQPFNGNLTEFSSMCHSVLTDNIPEIQRLHYLKEALVDEPRKLLKNLPMIHGSYAKAWQILKNRYENKRAIINSHLERLFNIEKISMEKPESLRNMLDTINECTTILKMCDIDVSTWDAILMYLLSQKLDLNTVGHWEEKLQGRGDLPTLNEFNDFLEIRFRILESTNRNRTSSFSSGISAKPSFFQKPKKILLTTNSNENRSCYICGENHVVYRCPRFSQAPVPERLKLVQSKKLCGNCLFKHETSECKFKFSCRLCQKRHHTMLHMDENLFAALTEIESPEKGVFFEQLLATLQQKGIRMNYRLLKWRLCLMAI